MKIDRENKGACLDIRVVPTTLRVVADFTGLNGGSATPPWCSSFPLIYSLFPQPSSKSQNKANSQNIFFQFVL